MTKQKLEDRPVQTDADGEKLSVISQDGVLNRLTLYRAAQDRAVIVCMPAMGVRASFYRPLAVQLALAGWHVVTADLRGVGESGVRVNSGAQFGYREMLEQDWPANLAVVRERLPGLPVSSVLPATRREAMTLPGATRSGFTKWSTTVGPLEL